MSRLSGVSVTTTWDAASTLDGNEDAVNVTVPGAKLGDFALASLGVDLVDMILSASVTAADTVTCVVANNTGATVDLASATLRVKVVPFDVI